MVRGVPNVPDPRRVCLQCQCHFPAERRHSHCCSRCRVTEGREHSSNCTGRAQERRAPPLAVAVNPRRTYRPSPTWTRRTDQDLLQFIHWFFPEGPDFPHDRWKRLEWTLQNVDRTRPVELVPFPAKIHFSGTVLDCHTIDARGAYDMDRVTGVDHKVIRNVCRSDHITSLLRDAVELIETYRLTVLGLRCHGGTHRSVSVAHLLMMLAYPKSVCRPLIRRVEEAAERRWCEWPVHASTHG